MLQRMRQSRRLHAVIFTAFALAWLVALLAGVQARVASAQLLSADVCTTATLQDAGAPHEPGGEADASHHHAPDCLLCIALATPSAATLATWRSPVPVTHQGRRNLAADMPAWRARAPLPARGPPAASRA